MCKWQDQKFQGVHAEYLDRNIPASWASTALKLPLHGKVQGETAPNSQPSSKESGMEGPVVWAVQALTMASSHLLHPTWPLEKLPSSASLEERHPTIWNPSDDTSPLAGSSRSPSTEGPHPSPTEDSNGTGRSRSKPCTCATALVPSRQHLSGLELSSRWLDKSWLHLVPLESWAWH